MDKNSHYLAVGLFVILITLAGVFFAGWLYKGQSIDNAKHYEIHFSESVDGLGKGSEVRYMGVKVGQVESAELLVDQIDKIRVVVSVTGNTPIYDSTIATLHTQVVTGVSYINLLQQATAQRKEPLIETLSSLPVIKSAPSELGDLLQSLPDMQQSVNQLLAGVNQVLNHENKENLSSILKNINALTLEAAQLLNNENVNNLTSILKNMDETTQAGPELVSDLQTTSKRLNHLISSMDNLITKNEAELIGSIKTLRTTMKTISRMSENYNRLAVQLNTMAINNKTQLNELIRSGSHDLKQLLLESKRAAIAIRRLGEKLEKNPSQIIYESTSHGIKIPQ